MPLLPTPGGSRQQLLAILEAANSDEGQALEKFLRTTPDAHACLLRVLTQLDYKESDARAHWDALQKHRDELTQTLRRKASLQLATLDYFQNLKGEIQHPKILEMSTFLETERSAISDGLTGLYNRQFFDAGLRRELKRARRYGLAFSLVMLDVDNFKAVNDRYGHVSGDEVLSLFSNVIRASVREIDVACRYGGEEFALILPETSRAGAFIVSERIRIDVEALFLRRRISGTQIDLSISGGIALYPTDANSAEGLIRMADRALYRSKHDGKNKITLHADEKRQSPRLDARKLLMFRESRDNGQSASKSQTKNLSRNGALLESRVPLNIGTDLQIDIHLPQNGADVGLKGRVVRLEETSEDTGDTRYYVGVVFLADTEEDNRQLEGFDSEIYRPLVHDRPREDVDPPG